MSIQLRNVLVLLSIALPLCGCGTTAEPAKAETAAADAPIPASGISYPTAPLLDPNSATAEQLSAIQGLSDSGVQAVLSGRPFATPTELHAAISEGMSPDDLRSIYSAMFVKVNLNTASTADFALVPSSMSPRRLAHEFDEYRPYPSMDEFRREMKKYFSDEEVAFLERYVFVE